MSMTFSNMGFNTEILSGLLDLNFHTPTPIQIQAIPAILNSSNDLLGFAQTGTGKTAAFSLPILQQIDTQQRHVQALILCPTRELCVQITKDINAFAKYLPNTQAVAIYGGSSMQMQIKQLKANPQIVVGTPGRIRDLANRQKLIVDKLRWLVLDEADDMLDKGFKEDLDAILDGTPENKQTLLFAATMSQWIRKVAQQRMHQPKEIRLSGQNEGADTVEHKYVTVHDRDRYAALRRLLDVNPDVYGIVFCRTRRQTAEVAAKLIANHYSTGALHGDIPQNERSDMMARFRKNEIQILVATDVAARGIDVNELTHVINYELPDSPETYVHRSGRTGRAGNTGISLTIINMKQKSKLQRIAKMMRKDFAAIDVPTGKEICKAQLMSLVQKVKSTDIDHDNLEPYFAAIQKELAGLTYEELIKQFVSVEFNRFLKYYSNVEDISSQKGQFEGRNRRNQYGKADKSMQMRSYQINFGRNQGFNPKDLFGLINKNSGLRGIEIGDIHIRSNHTEFEADGSYHKKTINFLEGAKYRK